MRAYLCIFMHFPTCVDALCVGASWLVHMKTEADGSGLPQSTIFVRQGLLLNPEFTNCGQ